MIASTLSPEPAALPLAAPLALTPAMIELARSAEAFAPNERPVLLWGETGVGKTTIAEYIRRLSGRPGGFHAYSIGTESAELAADKLFGHVDGAFTGARRSRVGLIATAGTGTLVLDDIQTLGLAVQKQLYQVMDTGVYFQVGSDREVSAVCRFVLAMTENPDVQMGKGLLLPDLRWRFGMLFIWVPPLRERRAEIPILATRTLGACPKVLVPGGPTRFEKSALALLCEADYPGNLRQLLGVVERAYLLARLDKRDVIRPEDLRLELPPMLRYRRRGDRAANRAAVEQMLAITGGNVKLAAERLGVSRGTINAIRAGKENVD